MVKFFMYLLLLVVIALGAVLLVRDDPGFLLLRYREWEVETSLAVAVVALIIAVIVVHIAFRFLRGLWRLPRNMKDRSQTRRYAKVRRQLTQGLIDLAEGRFEQAENHLVRLVDFSESPLVHYLSAARAAQLQGKHDARDGYLKAAHDANPGAELAIGVTQAELQLAHLQTEQALATLTHLHSVAPKHDYVTMLLARAYYELKDWRALVELLPVVRRRKLVKPARLRELELSGYRGELELASGNQQDFETAWSKLPKDLQADANLLRYYFEQFACQGWSNSNAEQTLLKAIDQQWDDGLIEVYGRYQARDATTQMMRVEKWLDDYGHNAQLLLALGRISVRARLWGKAQSYFEASIGARATAAACLELADLFEQQLQQPEKAVKYYQQGLKLCLENKT
ncbi:MAG: tetratricopeptide repeat protein [Gammaproteobacteria bacterium]|nr:tetratricopeptide repeat protein [Gammaproteobacteria bacterium]